MDAVLADALLSQCRDADALLRAVGGEDGALSAERAESLRLLLQRAAAASGGWRGEAAQKRVAREAALGRCLPTLLDGGGGAAAAGQSPQEWRRVVRAVCGALHCCAALCGSPLAEQLAREALHACEGTGWRQVEAAVEILAAVAPWLREPALLKRSAGLALGLLWGEEEESEEKAVLVAGRLLPALGRNGAALGHVWEGLMLPPETAPQRASRALLVLSALSDAVFPAGAQQRTGAGSAGEAAQVLDARLCSSFWTVVQKGLTENDALCRKRARYLLKRAVDLSEKLRGECRCSQDPGNEPCLFWWCAEKNEQLTHFWENYILIMETLEGNQIHVIKPVLPKLNSLYEYAVSKQKGCWLLHPSWHMCIYQRMFDSENKTLTKEGIIHFLEIWQTKDLPTSPEFSEFIIGPLMDALSESSLYSRASGQIIGTFPPLGMKLQKFLATFFTNLPDKEKSDFLLKFIQKMSNRHWCAVPILFLSMALAHIPAYRALDGEGLLALREVLQCTMITHQILLRGAAQCYLLEAAIHLTDTEKVSLSDISNFIICLRPDESLGRGTVLWTMLCDWLCINDRHFQRPLNCDAPQDKSVLSVYVQFLVKDYLKVPVADSAEDCLMPDGFEAKLVAAMILLAADVEEIRHEYNGNGCTERIELKGLLNPLLDILLKLGTNPYIASLKADKSLQLLLKLLQLCSVRCSRPQVDGVIMFLQNSFLPATESILDFLLRKLTANELDTIVDLQRCDLYLEVLSEFMNFCSTNVQKRGPSNCSFISSLINASLCNLQRMGSEEEVKVGDQIQKVVSMASLCAVCEIIDEKPELQLESLPAVDTLRTAFSCAKLNHVLKKPCSMETNSSLEEQASHQGWGKIVARYIRDQWVCLHFTLNNYQNLSKGKSLEQFFSIQKCTRTLQSALEAIMILPSDHVLPVFRCMQILISKLLESAESLCIETFDLAWKIIFSLSNTQLIFWPNLKAFVQFVFDPEVLAAAAKSKSQAYTKIKEIIFQMIEMSSTRTGVFNVLLSYCCQSWIHPTSDDSSEVEKAFSNASNYSELLIEGCLFGTVFRRDQRLIQEVCAFVQNLGDECAANVVTESTNRDDHYVRVCAIKFLCLLDELNTLHKKFIEDFVMKLLDKAEFMSKTKNRYYVNSLQHRIKNRLWQTLLVMFPKLHEDILTRTIDRILQAAHSNNQASVKYLIEWNIILILHKFPQFFPKFWDCFDYGEDHLKTSICTFLAVLSHFDIILQDTCEKTPALKKALVVVLKWCFHHNFSVRLYALMALKKIWGMCKASCMNDFETLAPVIESSLNQAESMHGTGNAKKNWQRIQKHFFFENFHPLNDYCLETIFYALPRLSEIAEEEWIPLSKFTAFTDIPCSSTFPCYYSQTTLLDLKPSDWSQQDMGLNSAEPGNQRQWTDVQKKIIPWKDSALDLDLELEFQDRTKLGKSSSKLIVVASLIDKPTNLGGLCRTCEIFGVSALIVGSLHCINDKQFQYLSVSAEQWLSLVEVKPFQLIDYLEQKKIEGYTIIGVEQTAKSCDLTEYQFPEKSLLLLGNEHEGIPANLIQQLDTCVEIPQQGVIRSLNVHVSGALLIWEYTRQQIIKENKER